MLSSRPAWDIDVFQEKEEQKALQNHLSWDVEIPQVVKLFQAEELGSNPRTVFHLSVFFIFFCLQSRRAWQHEFVIPELRSQEKPNLYVEFHATKRWCHKRTVIDTRGRTLRVTSGISMPMSRCTLMYLHLQNYVSAHILTHRGVIWLLKNFITSPCNGRGRVCHDYCI